MREGGRGGRGDDARAEGYDAALCHFTTSGSNRPARSQPFPISPFRLCVRWNYSIIWSPPTRCVRELSRISLRVCQRREFLFFFQTRADSRIEVPSRCEMLFRAKVSRFRAAGTRGNPRLHCRGNQVLLDKYCFIYRGSRARGREMIVAFYETDGLTCVNYIRISRFMAMAPPECHINHQLITNSKT